MVILYWIFEYIKMFIGYMFLMFVWPTVVFGRFMKGRSKTFWFSFCVTVQIVLINTTVLTLGLLHLLNPWVIRVLFYGTFMWAAWRRIPFGEKHKRAFKHLVTGTYGRKQFLRNTLIRLREDMGHVWRYFCAHMHSRWFEYGILGIVLVYGMIYFTYGVFRDHSYGFGDMYTHSAWIYGLTQGKIFSAGVYPEAMHCFAYGLHTLFGISIYSCLLFLAGLHILTFLMSAYIMLKEVFRWQFTPIFVLTAFLTLDVVCIDEVYSMSRLQWSLPQEFGLHTLFLCAAFLVRYAKSQKQIDRNRLRPETYLKKFLERFQKRRVQEEKKEEAVPQMTKGYWDENLFLFMMALAASLTIHFYPTIMAFFLCVSFVPTLILRIFNRKRLVPLIVAATCGFLIAAAPMVGALISGIPFQGSIGWAVNVINGTDGEDQSNIIMDEETGEEITGDLSSLLGQRGDKETENAAGSTQGQGAAAGSSGSTQSQGTAAGSSGSTQGQGTAAGLPSQGVQAPEDPFIVRLTDALIEKSYALYYSGYVTLYRSERAGWIVKSTVLGLGIWGVSRMLTIFVWRILKKRKSKRAAKIDKSYFDGYLSITLASVIFMMMYASTAIGLPSLIAGSRLCSTEQLLILAMMAVPVDLFFTLLNFILFEGLLKVVSVLCVAGIYAGTIMTGNFHGYLYYELTRHNGAVMTTQSIIESLPRNSYTIVSTTDEIYQSIQYGRHEEITNFLNECRRSDYKLPTEYVFIFVEKHPIEYAQSHFFTGPKWLAQEKYADYYESFVSQCPDITVSEISEEMAETGPTWFTNAASTYSNLQMRTMVESRIYVWCQKFSEIYPYEMHTYYEDDDFVCYYFKQNTNKLYQLSIW